MPKHSLSVIILVRDDGPFLGTFLIGLAQAVKSVEKVRGPIDVVIVDDGSRDGSAAIAANHLKLFARGRLLRLPWRCGPGIAAGAGISEAVGENLVVLSCEQAVDAAYLLGLLALLETADGVLSGPAPAAPAGPVARLRNGARAGRGRRTGARTGRPQAPVFVALRASVAQDLFLCHRPAGLGYDCETRKISEAMKHRLAHLPVAPAPGSTIVPARVRLATQDGKPVVPAPAAESVIDLTEAGQSLLTGLTAPAEQPGAVM